MSILSIESISLDDDGSVYVTAVVEDVVQTYTQTQYDPPEFGSGLCESSFILDEEQNIPDNDQELIQLLEELDLSWELVDTDNSDYDIGLTD